MQTFMDHFTRGVNLGGWLSQYARYDHAHFRSFITERDIERIAGWGLDHVRLPLDYPVLEDDAAPGVYREDGFATLDACFEWCRRRGLGVVLDLHHAPGYSFTNTLEPGMERRNVLFTEEAAQLRFIALWEAIARRYRSAGLPLVYELLNEIVLPDSAPWNALAQRAIAALRAIDPACPIMIGGNQYNSASELKNITLSTDPLVCYTFHFYSPHLFTHQNAYWMNLTRTYTETLDYPGSFTGLTAYLQTHPEYQAEVGRLAERTLDRDLVLEFLQPALDFARASGRSLYCGEFGVIDRAPMESARRWHTDVIAALRQHGIGRAVWSYKAMDFGLVNAAGQVVDPALVEIVCQS
jgi:hypothetical protein